MTGQAKLLGQPEYHDVEKAQEVLTSLDEDVISNLPATLSSGTTQILVGPENVAKELKDSSVVITKFDIGDGMQGMIGVVGPTENGLREDHCAPELFCRESRQDVRQAPTAGTERA